MRYKLLFAAAFACFVLGTVALLQATLLRAATMGAMTGYFMTLAMQRRRETADQPVPAVLQRWVWVFAGLSVVLVAATLALRV